MYPCNMVVEKKKEEYGKLQCVIGWVVVLMDM
jgi:hypothetical protein